MKKFSYLLSAMLICTACLFGCNKDDGNIERVNENNQVQEQDGDEQVQEQDGDEQVQEQDENNQVQEQDGDKQAQKKDENEQVQEQNNNNVNFNDIVNNGNRNPHNQGGNVDDYVSPDVVQRDYQALADNYSYFLDSLLQEVDDAYQIYGDYEWEVEIGYDENWENDYANIYVAIYLDSDEGWDEGYIYDENYLPMETLLLLMEDELETNYNIDYSDYYIGIDVYLDEMYVDYYDHEGWYNYPIDFEVDEYQTLVDNYSYFIDSLLQEIDDVYQIYGDYEWEVEIGYDEYWESDYANVYVAIYLDSDEGWDEGYIYDENYLPMETLLLMMEDELETNYNIDYADYYIGMDVYLDDMYVDCYDHEGWYWSDYYIDIEQDDYQDLGDNYSYFLDSLLQEMDDVYQIYGDYEWEVEIGYDQYWESGYADVYVAIYLDSDEGWDEDYIYDENSLPMETLLLVMQDELETNYNIDYYDYYITIDIYLDGLYVDSYFG